jgi:hypothetical protein
LQTQNQSLIFSANVLNITNANQVQLTVNGSVYSPGTYNNNSHVYQKTIALQNGENVITLTATNSCGSSTSTVKVFFTRCESPSLTLITPQNNNYSTNQSSVLLSASVLNISSLNQISVNVNGANVTGGSYSSITHVFQQSIALVLGNNVIKITATTDCGTSNLVLNITREEIEEEKVTICHYPPGNTGNPQQIEIPLSAWPAHQAHGDLLGPCPAVEEEKVTICHYPPGNTGNPQQIEIPLSAWPAHQAHGDLLGPCPAVEEEKVTICHYPPGNTGNPQQIEIPLSAWPAHQAHGDKLGPCPGVETNEETEEVENEGQINTTDRGKITICHYPPGNTGNPQQIEIPLSAWPAHQAHGDKLGPCSTEEEDTNNEIDVETENETEEEENQGDIDNIERGKVKICHVENGTYEEMEVPISKWPTHQAHGDKLGSCNDLEEAKQKLEQEAKAQAAAKLKAEQEAKLKAEQEAKAQAAAKLKAEQEAKLKAEQEAKVQAAAKLKAGQAAKLKAEQEAKAQAAAKLKAEQEAKEAKLKKGPEEVKENTETIKNTKNEPKTENEKGGGK